MRADLEKRTCTIPQSPEAPQPNNVIRGRFTSARQQDIAVLCSVKSMSAVLVFRGGSVTDVAQLGSPSEDKDFLQTIATDTIGFSRMIGVARPERIRLFYREFGGPKPPRLDHDGIEDMFVGKASGIIYWFKGKWLELTGMD